MAQANGLVPSEDGKKMNCSFCNCWLPSTAKNFINAHLSGKKHIYNVQNQQNKKDKIKRSVYVKGFDPLVPFLEEELKNFFKALDCEVNDIYVDKNMAAYAIVEFTSDEYVEQVMQQEVHMFFGKKLIIRRRESHSDSHLSKKTFSSKYSEEFFAELDKCINVDQKMQILYSSLRLTQDDLVLRQLICELLQNVMEEVYSKCKVVQFGSSVNGLGIKDCDIDITLLIEPDERDEIDIMNEIRDIIQRFAPGCKNVSLVQSSKSCTIVKFLHAESSLSIDLSLNNRLAIANTELLTTYINAEKRVTLLLFTVRAWSQKNNLAGRSGLQLSSYALTLMVVHFLQHTNPPVLFCLQDCCILEELMINDWNCSFCKMCMLKTSENQKTAGELLKEFFEYYKIFDFSKFAVVIHSSKLVLKEEVKESFHKSIETLNTNCPILVQDPFKRSHNVAQNISLAGKELFVRMFTVAESYLSCSFNKLFQKFEVKHKKRKQKKNHSYSVCLPNCKHTSKDSLLYCEKFVLDLLKKEFKLFVEIKKNIVVQNTLLKNNLDQGTSRDEGLRSDSLKRSSEDTTELSSKRYIVEETYFRIVAQNDTWTNRRKNQRVFKNKEFIESEPPNQSEPPNTKLQAQSDATLFDCLLHFEQGKHPDVVCKINIEPCNSENNLLQFQTFFAVLKKSLLSVFH